MRCFSPITIKNTKNGVTTKLDVPCGKCAACLSRERKTWQTRLELENRYSTNAKFVTLTYADQYLVYGERVTPEGEIIKGVPVLNKVHIQNFFKRFREKNKNKIKYYLVGEYGETTQRPHYHMLLFNSDNKGDQLKIDILESWKKGSVDIGTVTQRSISYTLNYMSKDKLQRNLETFRLMSKGLGLEYANRNADWHRASKHRDYITIEGGERAPIPRYLKQKIYNKFTSSVQAKIKEAEMQKLQEKKDKDWRKKNPIGNQFADTLDKQKNFIKKQSKNTKSNGL